MNKEAPREETSPVGIQIYELGKMSPLDKAMIMRRAHEDIEGVKREVFPIIADIRARGDEAILEYLERFDNVRLTKEELVVSEKDVREAYQNTDPLVLEAIRKQIALSRKFHHAQESQIPRQWEVETIPGVRLGQKKTAIDSVGLYVPGGTAPYPTVMQILAVPAKIAGVERIVGVTPPRGKNYEVIVAAEEEGVDEGRYGFGIS